MEAVSAAWFLGGIVTGMIVMLLLLSLAGLAQPDEEEDKTPWAGMENDRRPSVE